jgi:hypothetical protein
MKKNFYKKNVSLVLLCNVDPKNVIHTKRKNIEDRISDFEKSLPFWLSLDLFKNIIIIENSNFKGDLFKKHIRQSTNKKNIELMIYDGQKYNRKLGKGFGWYQQIDKVIKYSKKAKESEYFVIVTGRYIINNIEEMLLKTETPLMCDITKNLSFGFSPVTLFSKDFIKKYWLKFCSQTNDSKGKTMEHQQAKAILRAISDDYKWQLPPVSADIIAVSAISNTAYRRNFLHSLILKYYSYLKKFIFEFKR